MKAYSMKGLRMYRQPSNRTIERLKKCGYKVLVWRNGDFLYI